MDAHAFQCLGPLLRILDQGKVGQPSQDSSEGIFKLMVQPLQEPAPVLGKVLLRELDQVLVPLIHQIQPQQD